MSSLLEFLAANEIENETEKVYPSARFKQPFTIKALSQEQFDDLQKRCKIRDKKKGAVDFDSAKFSVLCVEECCVEPNFRDAQTLKNLGFATGVEFIKKRLKPGEIAELSGKIACLSGFDEDINDLVEEAKN